MEISPRPQKPKSRYVLQGIGFMLLFALCQFMIYIPILPVLIISIFAMLASGDLNIDDVVSGISGYGSDGIDLESISGIYTNVLIIISLFTAAVSFIMLFMIADTQGVNPLEGAKLKKTKWINWALCFICGLAANFFFSSLITLVPFPESIYSESSSMGISLNAKNALIYTVTIAFVVPISEEISFRALGYGILRKGCSEYIAIMLSSLIFGIMHGAIIALVYTIPLGIINCIALRRSGSLWTSIMIHSGFNFASVLVSLLPEVLSTSTLVIFCCAGLVISALAYAAFLKSNPKLYEQQVMQYTN